MNKRILSALLASLIFLISVPVQTVAAAGTYAVHLQSDSQDKVLGAGDTVKVTVMVTGADEAVKTYNAYDLKLSYDTQRLVFVSGTAADRNADITEADGRIRVKGYGDAKGFSTAAATLTFKAQHPGKADVSITHAKIDISDNAGLQNAPEAALVENTVKISIDGYEVVVDGEGVGAASYVATSTEDYVFWLKEYENYTYSVKVTIAGVDMTSKVTCDEETGKYTIPQNWIDGKIEITAERTPQIYTVTITGDDVSGEKTAEYNTDYTFRLEREEGYLYTIEIGIDKEEYTGYNLADDTYTIPGTDITGNIRIKVIKTEDDTHKVTVTFAGAGAKDGSGEKKTYYGVEYPFKLKKKKGYTYSVTVYVNGKRTPYDYDPNLDTHYILADNVSGNIVIVIGKVATLEVSEYVTLDQKSMYLIVYNGVVGEGQVPKYDGRSMYWSDRYRAYAWLVVSEESEKKAKKTAEGKITLNEGVAAGAIDYNGNVNMTLQTDLEDAKLTQEMYQGKHSLDFMDMQKLLSADVCSDRKLNVRDVAAIVKRIS